MILAGITDSIRQIQDPLITVYAMAYLLYVTQSMSMPECSSEHIIYIAESTLLGFASKQVCPLFEENLYAYRITSINL